MQNSEAPVSGAERSSPCHFCNNNNIFFRRRPLLSSTSERPSPIMSTTESAESDKLDAAVKKMIQYREITVKDAMQLAEFTADEIENKNMQRKVIRRLPGKGKCKLKAMAMVGGDGASIISADVVNREKIQISRPFPTLACQVAIYF